MEFKDFISLFDSPCSTEELFRKKEEILEIDFVDEQVINDFFDAIRRENKPLIDRQTATRALVTYICTTGDFCYFIRASFREFLIKDGCTKEVIEQVLKQASEQAKKVRIANKEKAFQEKQKKELALKRLEESIDLSKTAVSYDTARFLIRNGITYEALKNTLSVAITSQEDIDPILHKYRIGSDGEKEMISIADVVGYEYRYTEYGNDLLKALPNFFDSNKTDGYHTRSLSMLDLTTDNVIKELSPSFEEEPMKVADAPGGRYTINGNGMHRYTVLRTLYLIEMARANKDPEREQAIREKYTVPALVSKIDYIKTYSNFVLTTLKAAYWVGNERDDRNYLTGRAKLELVSGENLFLTNEELIAYVRNIMLVQKDNPSLKWLLERKDPSFTQFLSLVVPEMLEGYVREEEHVKIA